MSIQENPHPIKRSLGLVHEAKKSAQTEERERKRKKTWITILSRSALHILNDGHTWLVETHFELFPVQQRHAGAPGSTTGKWMYNATTPFFIVGARPAWPGENYTFTKQWWNASATGRKASDSVYGVSYAITHFAASTLTSAECYECILYDSSYFYTHKHHEKGIEKQAVSQIVDKMGNFIPINRFIL